MKSKKINRALYVLFAGTLLFTACDVEDPFVDRIESPVLLVFDEVSGYLAGGGLTYSPSVTKSVTLANYTDPVTLSLTVYELDKSGILDHTIGIDSIPLSDFAITFSKRDGTMSTELTSDSDGKVTMTTTWQNLGVADIEAIVNASASKTITIPLTWVGTYRGISFAKYSQVVFSKPTS